MTAVQDTFDDILHAVVTDWRPSRVDSREAIRQAVMAAAADRGGYVHITGIRRHLPAWVAPAQIGAVMNLLARRGFVVKTGHYEPNGDTSARNGNKPSPLWRLRLAIPPSAVQS